MPINRRLGRSNARPHSDLSGCHGTDALSHSAREQVQTLQAGVTVDNFPRFLWEGERVDLQDINKGFLRGELLVKVCTVSLPC